MSSPDADDASPTPEHSGDQAEGDMAEQKILRAEGSGPQSQTSSGQKPNAKDPQRPRRKKARRACFACQRAHLTCGDERPCLRCVKRGLGEGCQDGLRKKAKYLDGTPTEALLPGAATNYHHHNGSAPMVSPAVSLQSPTSALPSQATYFPANPTDNFNMYPPHTGHPHMPIQPMQDTVMMNSFSGQATPISPPFAHTTSQQSPSVPSTLTNKVSHLAPTQIQGYGELPFDPSDPAFFNFDITGLNFTNKIGAMEFGMLGHISSGAAETPPLDANAIGPLNAQNVYGSGGSSASIPYGPMDWQSHSRQGSLNQNTPQSTPATIKIDQNSPSAFAIGHGSRSISTTSPGASPHDFMHTHEGGPVSPFVDPDQQQVHGTPGQQGLMPRTNGPLQPVSVNAAFSRRHHNTKKIYEGINDPYSYTEAFHRFQRLLKSRLPSSQVLKIAKAMAIVRPSFIRITGDLTRDDLVHSERSLQRKLLVYEEELEYSGTPTLICRRTGEVVAVSKEFSLVTGWKKDILLGDKPNLNVARGGPSADASGTTSRGSLHGGNTASNREDAAADSTMASGASQPVFLAELLDHDSVVQFYQDFAQLAFGDSRGRQVRRVKLIKYRTQKDEGSRQQHKGHSQHTGGIGGNKKLRIKLEERLESVIAGGIGTEESVQKLADADGMIDCMMTWCVWHDIFEMPAILSFNFLPIIE